MRATPIQDGRPPPIVAYLRARASADPEHPRLRELVRDLTASSREFERLWANHDVQTALSGNAPLLHPDVGPIELRYQTIRVDGADDQTLMVVHAAPGSADTRALARLAGSLMGAA